MLLGIDEIRARLPHRAPILLPREVRIEEAGRAGYSYCCLDAGVRLLGHASQRDLARELLLECAAQTLGVVLGSVVHDLPSEDERHLLLGFDHVRYDMQHADLDAPFRIDVHVVESSGAAHVAAFRVEQARHWIAEGTLMVMKG